MTNFRVERLDGTVYDMAEMGVIVRDFNISAPDTVHNRETIDGRDGFIDLGTTFGGREITADCVMKAVDIDDYGLLRNEVFRAFNSREAFYVIADNNPGQRWLVKYDGSWAMEQTRIFGEFTLKFVSESAYAESIGTTLDPLTFDAELWQVGQGLTVDATDYTQTAATFSIYNAGDVTVDPREFPLVITFKGASTNLAIVNSTTVTEWDYTGTTTASDTVMLDGVRMLKNGVSVFANTNRKLVTLAPGWNDIQVFGATGAFTISFDFRFRYI
jgi:phage-related protein